MNQQDIMCKYADELGIKIKSLDEQHDKLLFSNTCLEEIIRENNNKKDEIWTKIKLLEKEQKSVFRTIGEGAAS